MRANAIRPYGDRDADCHTSDFGHWFAMTGFIICAILVTYRNTNIRNCEKRSDAEIRYIIMLKLGAWIIICPKVKLLGIRPYFSCLLKLSCPVSQIVS